MLPEPLILDRPGSIRWAARRSDGSRSQTWLVKATTNQKNEDSVYIGSRQTMGDMKLSLHEGWWGFGFTGDFAKARGLAPGDRSRIVYEPNQNEVAAGWSRAAVVLTPSTTFSASLVEHTSSHIQWYEAPEPPLHLEWHVFLGEPDVALPTLPGAIDVGRMTVPSGRQVWVVGAEANLLPETEQTIEGAKQMIEAVTPRTTGPLAIASGDRAGVPLHVDLADAQP